MSVTENILNFIKEYHLNGKKSIYLVAFSGGPDSICLLDILKKTTPNTIIAIHLNHNWRGEESDKEEENCKNFARKIGVEFYSEKLSDKVAQNETAARDARYDFFERCAKKFNSNIIFTAHNKNDNAETLIYRICRGTGIPGLQGISPNRGVYYRPLLNTTREEIENYCKINKLIPNIDSSNEDTIHMRNYIRKEIIPLLTKINPNILDSLNSLSFSAREDTQIADEYIDVVLKQITKDNKILTKKYLKLSEAVQYKILYKLIVPLVPQDYSRERLTILHNFIMENSNSKSGKTISATKDYMFFASEKFIELYKNKEKYTEIINITEPGIYEHPLGIFEIQKYDSHDKNGVLVNLSKVDFIFQLRTRQDGDIFYPLNGVGHQKLKKYLNSKKIPNHEKDSLLFLAQNKEILWGETGISDIIKSGNNPTHIIKYKRK